MLFSTPLFFASLSALCQLTLNDKRIIKKHSSLSFLVSDSTMKFAEACSCELFIWVPVWVRMNAQHSHWTKHKRTFLGANVLFSWHTLCQRIIRVYVSAQTLHNLSVISCFGSYCIIQNWPTPKEIYLIYNLISLTTYILPITWHKNWVKCSYFAWIVNITGQNMKFLILVLVCKQQNSIKMTQTGALHLTVTAH